MNDQQQAILVNKIAMLKRELLVKNRELAIESSLDTVRKRCAWHEKAWRYA